MSGRTKQRRRTRNSPVSVVLPVYNAEATLHAALESLIKQSYAEFELIAIDDGSNDRSPAIIEYFSRIDPRIKVIRQPHSGIVTALNLGLRHAAYDLVARMDADDIAHPARLAKQAAFLDSHQSIVAAGSFYREIDQSGEVLSLCEMPRSPAVIRNHLTQRGNALAHPTVMFRRSIVLAAGGYREVFKYAEDYDLWLRLAEMYDLENIDEFLLDYRRNPTGVSLGNLEQQHLSALGARYVSELRRRGLADPSDTVDTPVSRQMLLDWGVTPVQLNESMHEWIEFNRRILSQMGKDEYQATLRRLERSYSGVPVASPNRMVRARYRRARNTNFSVVIPAYNHGRYVRRAVVSALRSALVDEVLIVDDGSNDNTRELIAELVGQWPARIRDLTSSPVANLGAHTRLNQLVAEARNEYVAVLNSDDLFLLHRFEILAMELTRHSFDLAFGDMLLIDAQDRFISAKRGPLNVGRPFPKDCAVDALVVNGSAEKLLFHQNFAGSTSNFVFSKQFHSKVGGFRDFRYVHDWDFILRALLLGTVRYIRHYLTAYRFHDANTISESVQSVDVEIGLMAERLLADYPDKIAAAGASDLLTSYTQQPYSKSAPVIY